MDRMPIDAIIFDCDGTLVDSEPLGFAAMVRTARDCGIEVASDDELLHLKGQSMTSCLQALERMSGRVLPTDFEARVRERMSENFRSELKVIEGAAELLAGLNVPFCVASNGPLAKMDLTLGITGLLPHLEGRIFSAYEVGSWKPDPGLFLHAAAAMGVSPQSCAVVEDSVSGMRAGLAAGMHVFAFHPPESLADDLKDRVEVLHRLTDLLAMPWNQRSPIHESTVPTR